MKACHRLGVEQIFTSYNNPKAIVETERMMRTIKEEHLWLRKWTEKKRGRTSPERVDQPV